MNVLCMVVFLASVWWCSWVTAEDSYCFPERLSAVITASIYNSNGGKTVNFEEMGGAYIYDTGLGAEYLSLSDKSGLLSIYLIRYDLGLQFLITNTSCTYSKTTAKLEVCQNATVVGSATVAGDAPGNFYLQGPVRNRFTTFMTVPNGFPVFQQYRTFIDGGPYVEYIHFFDTSIKPIPLETFKPPSGCVPSTESSLMPAQHKAVQILQLIKGGMAL